MLDSISWQEFFTTVAILIGAYYVTTALLLYSSEIINIFKQKKSKRSSSGIKPDQYCSNESNDLMGSVRYENSEQKNVPREESLNAEELQVTPQLEEEEPVHAVDLAEENLKNDFLSVQSEINSLLEVVSQGSKEESIPLFKTLLSNYSQFIDTGYEEQVSQFICDSSKQTCQFHFESNEINSWWAEIKNTTSNNN
jgi:hypothetical protein